MAVFLVKKRQKRPKSKKSFFVAFLLLGSIYIENFRNFHQMVWILPNFLAVFWLKNGQKRPKSKKSFFVAFFLLGSIYLPNFRKFHQTVWILPIFFIFVNFGRFFSQKRPKKAKKGKNRKSGSVVNFHLLKGIYIPNFRKFHQTVPKIICDGRTNERTNAQTNSQGWFNRHLRFATGDQ